MTVRYCIVALLTGGVLLAQSSASQVEIKELEEAARKNGADAETHGRLGLAYRKLGRLTEAAESLKQAAKLSSDPRLEVLLAFTYIDLGDCQPAIPLLTSSFEKEQKIAVQAVIGQRLVDCLLTTGAPEQALPYVQKLRGTAPDDPQVLYLSTKTYMSLWNAAFQSMVAKSPESHHVRLIQAEALEAQGRFAEAAQEYREVLKLAPGTSDIHYKLGFALLRSQSNEAAAEFQKQLAINRFHVPAMTELGELLVKKGESKEAARLFSEAIQIRPSYIVARLGLAKILIADKQWSQALEHLQSGVELAPENSAVHYNLMLTYRALGRADEAKKAFDRFQSLKAQRQ